MSKPMSVQTLVAELAVEALDEAVLDRLARTDEVELDASAVGPSVERSTGEFRPIVDDQGPRQPAVR